MSNFDLNTETTIILKIVQFALNNFPPILECDQPAWKEFISSLLKNNYLTILQNMQDSGLLEEIFGKLRFVAPPPPPQSYMCNSKYKIFINLLGAKTLKPRLELAAQVFPTHFAYQSEDGSSKSLF